MLKHLESLFWQDRDFIIGFTPHGSGAKYLNESNVNFVGVIS